MNPAIIIGAVTMAELVLAFIGWAWDENPVLGFIWTTPLAMNCMLLAFGDVGYWALPATLIFWIAVLASELVRAFGKPSKNTVEVFSVKGVK